MVQGNTVLADAGTTQMEMIALTQRTNDSRYAAAVRRLHRTPFCLLSEAHSVSPLAPAHGQPALLLGSTVSTTACSACALVSSLLDSAHDCAMSLLWLFPPFNFCYVHSNTCPLMGTCHHWEVCPWQRGGVASQPLSPVPCPLYAVCPWQSEAVITQIEKVFPADGLCPIYLNPQSGTFSGSHITFGAMGDRSGRVPRAAREELGKGCERGPEALGTRHRARGTSHARSNAGALEGTSLHIGVPGPFMPLLIPSLLPSLPPSHASPRHTIPRVLLPWLCSFYEYLLKVWVLGGKTDTVKRYRSGHSRVLPSFSLPPCAQKAHGVPH